jgi:1,2-diacylglycerol 3-alpha-glucosyltransferase
MNVGIVTYWFERGASYVSRAYKNVLEKENNVFVYARGGEEFSKGNPDWDHTTVTWDTHYYSRIATYISLDRFKNWLKEKEIDIVIFNEQHWWLPVLLCKELGVKTGAYIDYYTRETVSFFEAYDFLICNTKRHASVFSNHPQCVYIPWGTDVQLFKPTTRPGLVQKGVVTFFHSAGYSPDRKGTDLLIKAFSKMNNDSSRLIIHCQKPLIDFFPELSQTIQNLVKSDRLTIIEKTITAPGLYHLGDVYVYPTKLEGIGLTIAEALSCGLPVITSDNPPMSEFITSETGSLVKIDFFKERFDKYYWPECYCSVADLTAQMEGIVRDIEYLPALKRSSRQHAI